jgi:hypothetical protein
MTTESCVTWAATWAEPLPNSQVHAGPKKAGRGFTWGLFASKPLSLNEVVEVCGTLTDAPDRWTIRTNFGHVEAGIPARAINHACGPSANVAVIARAVPGCFAFLVLRPIGTGEELTMDYKANGEPIVEAFDCHCGDSLCYGRVGQ